MKKLCLLYFSLILLIIAGCSDSDNGVGPDNSGNTPNGYSEIIDSREVLFQVSTIDALLLGLFDGEMTFGSLGLYGDFGLGTVDGLDGELVILDGVSYQVRTDGIAYVVDNAATTPFAAVTDFDTDASFATGAVADFNALTALIDGNLPTENIFYAIKITGTFAHIKTRSVPKQEKPYPLLTEVVKDQAVFDFDNVEGTIVGFRCPPYVEGINVPGYHLHFLTKDKSAGGHLLDVSLSDAKVELDYTNGFKIYLPESNEFYTVSLDGDKQGGLDDVEH